MAYVTDTTARADAKYLDAIRGVDLLVHECYFPDSMAELAALTGHSVTTRVAQLARNAGVDAYMIDRAEQLQEKWLEGKTRIGITAGASAPEVLVQEVISRLKQIGSEQEGGVLVDELSGVVEAVVFPLPKS